MTIPGDRGHVYIVISDVIIVMLWVNIALVTFLFMSLLPPYSLCTLQMKVYRQENVFDEINPGEYVISDQDPTAHDKCLCVLAPDRIAQCHNVSPSL